jgi:hypothetical protein
MKYRFFASLPGVVLGVVFLTGSAAGQARWTPARTPDGQPDIQGVWTNPTITPFERPEELGTQAFLSEDEVQEVEALAAANSVDQPPPPGSVGSYNRFWFDSGTRVVSTRQTSLVVDPPNGRVPVKDAAEARRDDDLRRIGESWVHMSPWDRCITRGVPGGMFPAGYNNAYQILQVPGYVVILYEMIHEARIIPVDDRPHLPPGLRQWNGDSRGRWEGDTLVVDTINFNGKGWIATNAAAGRIRGIPQSEALHVIERFTRVDEDMIVFEVTIEDPNVYDEPWTVVIPLNRDPGYQIYEYACHEGNQAVANILSGGRARDEASGNVDANE